VKGEYVVDWDTSNMALLGGTIAVGDAPGGGAAFRFDFTAPVAEVTDVAATDRNAPVLDEDRPLRVLAAEDNAANRHVLRVLLEGSRAVGVEGNALVTDERTDQPLDAPGRPGVPLTRRIVVRAPIVVLSAGALRTPAILQATGVDHPSIGRHLRLHPVPVVAGRLVEPVDMWRGTMQGARSLEFGDATADRNGYAIEAAPGHPGLLALALPWEGRAAHQAMMDTARFLTTLNAVTRDGGERLATTTRAGRRGPE